MIRQDPYIDEDSEENGFYLEGDGSGDGESEILENNWLITKNGTGGVEALEESGEIISESGNSVNYENSSAHDTIADKTPSENPFNFGEEIETSTDVENATPTQDDTTYLSSLLEYWNVILSWSWETQLIAAAVVILVVILIVITIIVYCVRWKRRSRTYKPAKDIRLEQTPLKQELLPPNRTASSKQPPSISAPIPTFYASDIDITYQIGKGCFGNVFKANLNGEIVAVKVVQKEYMSEVIGEMKTMSNLSHPNILPLLGIAVGGELETPWLLFEYMEYGDLAGVLRNKSLRRISGNNEFETPFVLTYDYLLEIARQIAEGMKYLSLHHFVHRDLAARNCLVSASGVVKISDFGLSRDLYVSDYYKMEGKKLLPLRWMSPESILYGCFTTESDIWSYGVVLWEIYTWGKQPFYGRSNEEVVSLIEEGGHLPLLKDMPSVLEEIMVECWKAEPKSRISFPEICYRLSKFS